MKRGFFSMRGRGTALLVLCLSLFLVTNVAAVERHLVPLPNASAPPPLKLAIAGGSFYTTDAGLNALAGATSTAAVSIDACQQGVIYVAPNGSRYIEDITNTVFCGGRPDYYLINAPAQVRSFTALSFHNGASRSSFKMPPLGAVTPDAPSFVGTAETLTNTERQQTRVLCGFPGSEGTITVDVYDSDANLLTKNPEVVRCYAPITIATLATKFQSGYVVVRSVSSGFSFPGCDWCAGGTVYGAIVVSTPTNGNARIYPFGDTTPR